MRLRSILTVGALLLAAIVLQTTLFSQTEPFIPDVVMLVVILLCLTRIRPELLLGIGFVSGIAVDLLGSTVLGLQAIVFTVVAYLAIRTKDRADVGRIVTGLWAGMMTLAGVVLLIVVGTLFQQSVLLGEGVVDRLFLVPLTNTIFALVVAPTFVRVVDRDSTAFRYA